MSKPLKAPHTGSTASRVEPSYEDDFVGWTAAQAAHLRAGNIGALDLLRLAEEIEGVGRQERDKLRSALAVVLHHMLKWDHQPDRSTRSWALSIREHRRRVAQVLEDNPSLKAQWVLVLDRAYDDARDRAAAETGIDLMTFPSACPYSDADITSRAFPFGDP